MSFKIVVLELPDLSTLKSDAPNTKTFKPYHLCLQEYLKRRLKLVNVNSTVAYKRRSKFVRKFWMRKRAFNRCILSSIILKKIDIRPCTIVEIFGLEYSAL